MAEPPSSPRRFDIESALYLSLVAALLLLYLAPIWSVRYLPTLDLPAHLSLASAYHRLGESGSLASQVYEARHGLSPYWTFYGLTSWLMHLMPPLAALKVMLGVTALGLVGGFMLALRGFGRSRWLVFLIFPLLYDVNASYGYVAYRLSVALALGSVGLVRRDLDEPRLWRQILLGALALLAYLTHAHGFAVLVVLWGFAVLLAVPAFRLRPLARALLPLLPALALSAKWYLAALLSAGPPGSKVQTTSLPLIRLVELIPHRMLNSLSDGRDELVAIGLFLVWAGLVVASPRPEPAPELHGAARLRWRLGVHLPELATLLMIIFYFASPLQILTPTQQIYGINYRFLVVIGLLAALVPRLSLSRRHALAMAPALLLSTYFGAVMFGEYRAFDARLRPSLDRVLAALPPSKRVMAFSYEANDPRFTVPVLPHLVGYYCALKDGVSSLDQSFTSYRYMPLKLRDERAHPIPPFPGPIDIRFFGARYDYILIADRPGSKRAPFDARLTPLLVEAGPFRVYRLR